MIDVSRAEAMYLREHGRGKDVYVSGKNHGSNGHSFFITTSHKTMKLLNEYRKQHNQGVTKESLHKGERK